MGDWSFFPKFLLRATGFPIERLTSVATDDIGAERRALFAALGDDRAREALLTSAPLVDTNFDGWRAHAEAGRRNAQDKKRERVLWRFLQRLTAKNDSTSFFGAVALGDFEQTSEVDAVLPVEVSRRAYSTQWVVEKVLGAAVEDLVMNGHWPDVERAFRRAPGADERGVVWEAGSRGFSRSDEAPVVGPDLLPSGLVDPVAAAREVLLLAPASETRDRWLAKLDRLAALREDFAASAGDVGARRLALHNVEHEAKALLGEAATRHEGEFYASRSPVHEQAERCPTVGLPAGWRDQLEKVSRPLLDLSVLAAMPERLTFSAWFAKTFDGEVLWREVLAEAANAGPSLMLAAPPIAMRVRATLEQVRASLREQIAAGATELEPPPIVAELMAELEADPTFGRPFANPDFMVVMQRQGDQPTPRFLLAESHHLPHLTGCLLPSLQACDAVVAETHAFLTQLCAPTQPAFPVSWDHSFISVGPDLGAVGLELSGLAKEPPERRATLVDLRVRHDGGRLLFRVRTHAGHDLEVAPITRSARLWQASPVWSAGTLDLGEWLAAKWRPLEQIPRLAYGGLIVHRQRFRAEPGDLKAEAGLLASIAARSAVPAEALPRFMFTRVESEPKPILIDWQSTIGRGLAEWSLGRGEALTLSEMLPGPSELWLRGPDGTHTAELRTVMARGR